MEVPPCRDRPSRTSRVANMVVGPAQTVDPPTPHHPFRRRPEGCRGGSESRAEGGQYTPALDERWLWRLWFAALAAIVAALIGSLLRLEAADPEEGEPCTSDEPPHDHYPAEGQRPFKGPRMNLLAERLEQTEARAPTRRDPDRLEELRWTLWTSLLRWLTSELRPSLPPSALLGIAEGCRFDLVAHKDQERCRLSASLAWAVPGFEVGDTCATSTGDRVPSALIAEATEVAALLLERLRKRQKEAHLPYPPLGGAMVPDQSEGGAIVVGTSVIGDLDVRVVQQDGERWALPYVKNHSERTKREAIEMALADSAEGSTN
jgi:hypothetical protein